ncbi:hypothetical protein CCP1ISM_250002 [Azospirillaceae bacterium]
MKKRKTKKKPYQTGKSNKKNDQERKAKKPGVRKTKTGSTYIERRKNRSDMPGKLTGYDRKLEEAIKKVAYIDNQIEELQKKIKDSKSSAIKQSYRAIIRMRKNQLVELKKYIRRSK